MVELLAVPLFVLFFLIGIYIGKKIDTEPKSVIEDLSDEASQEDPVSWCIERFDDGSEIWIDTVSGGASEHGLYGKLTLVFFDAKGREYLRDYIGGEPYGHDKPVELRLKNGKAYKASDSI